VHTEWVIARPYLTCRVKSKMGETIAELRKDLVDTQNKLDDATGTAEKRRKMIEIARQALLLLKPWVSTLMRALA